MTAPATGMVTLLSTRVKGWYGRPIAQHKGGGVTALGPALEDHIQTSHQQRRRHGADQSSRIQRQQRHLVYRTEIVGDQKDKAEEHTNNCDSLCTP